MTLSLSVVGWIAIGDGRLFSFPTCLAGACVLIFPVGSLTGCRR
ncbi:hypothetical protein [Gordonia asplenii]|nr:hypothetical protein [Gordonia asplenii]